MKTAGTRKSFRVHGSLFYTHSLICSHAELLVHWVSAGHKLLLEPKEVFEVRNQSKPRLHSVKNREEEKKLLRVHEFVQKSEDQELGESIHCDDN